MSQPLAPRGEMAAGPRGPRRPAPNIPYRTPPLAHRAPHRRIGQATQTPLCAPLRRL